MTPALQLHQLSCFCAGLGSFWAKCQRSSKCYFDFTPYIRGEGRCMQCLLNIQLMTCMHLSVVVCMCEALVCVCACTCAYAKWNHTMGHQDDAFSACKHIENNAAPQLMRWVYIFFCRSFWKIWTHLKKAEEIKIKQSILLRHHTDLQVSVQMSCASAATQTVTSTDGKTNEQKCVLECEYAL